MDDLISRQFVELVVEYPDPELCTYNEYKGKPYYSIKYIENGKTYVGYGTYKPEVLSRYLREYFMPSAQPERKNGEWKEIEVIADTYDISGVKTWASKMQCDQCGFTTIAVEGHFSQYNFCPNCGADMREQYEQKSDDGI